MPFPISDREIYANNPLVEVICQFRFPTILSISSQPPAKFQEEIRGEYPWYEQQGSSDVPDMPVAIRESLPAEIRDALPGLGLVQGPASYSFQNADRTRTITLAQDSIAVSESHYRQWDDFKAEVERAESILREIYAPSFYTRVGLRYRDVLDRSEYGLDSVPWSDLLNPVFLGVLGSNEIARDVEQSQTRILLTIPDVEGGRVWLQHGIAMRDDGGSPVYLIDADFFTLTRCNHDAAFKAANKFNKWGGHLFRWAITNTLRAALEPRLPG